MWRVDCIGEGRFDNHLVSLYYLCYELWFTTSTQGSDKTTSAFSGEIGIFDVVQVCGFRAADLTVKVCLRSGMSSVKLILILRTVSCSRWHLQTIINLLSRISDSSFLFGLRQTLGRLMVLGLGQETQCVVTDVNLKICRAMKIGYLEELNLLFVSSLIWMSMMSYTNVNSKHSNICQPFMSSPTNELAKKSGLPPAIPLPSSFALPTVVDDLHQPGELSDCKRAKSGAINTYYVSTATKPGDGRSQGDRDITYSNEAQSSSIYEPPGPEQRIVEVPGDTRTSSKEVPFKEQVIGQWVGILCFTETKFDRLLGVAQVRVLITHILRYWFLLSHRHRKPVGRWVDPIAGPIFRW